MSDKVSLVRVLTSATGNSTPITLGARYSDLFMTPADAGAVDGRTYTWLIVDGNNWELVKGVYTASGTTAARTTVLASRSGGTLGTSRITLSGTAQVRIVESAVDMDGVRGTRAVTGTSDALAATDRGYVVTYSNAAAVAVSLAQAGTASLYDGWGTTVQNLGVGAVTITAATSTINGATTLVLPSGHGAFIWSDGTNYHAYFMANRDINVSTPLATTQNLNLVTNSGTYYTPDSAATNGPAGLTDFYFLQVETMSPTFSGDFKQTLTALQADQMYMRRSVNAVWLPWVRLNPIMRGYLAGLTLSTAGGSGSFGIAAGVAADSTNIDYLTLSSAYTKTTSAWALGTAAGSLDTGTIAASTWYHAYLIKRPDTGVVDVLISSSATAPTLPTNYTLFRRIGAIKTNGSSQWVLFRQDGDVFTWDTPITELSGIQFAGLTQQFVTLAGSPTGIKARAFGPLWLQTLAVGGAVLITGADQQDTTPTANTCNVATPNNTVAMRSSGWWSAYTSTASSIRYRINAADASTFFNMVTLGYEDTRGRNN